MTRGLPASIIAHAAVFSASYFTFPYWGGGSRAYVAEIEAVDVNFAELGEITDLRSIVPQESEEPEEIPEQPEDVPEEEPIEEDVPEAEEDVSNVEEAAAPDENPEDLLPNLEEEKPEEPEEEPQQEPDPKPAPPKDPLADFLNRSETTFKSEIETKKERPDPPPVPPRDEPKTELKDPPKVAEERPQRGAGERNANIVRLEALIYSRVKECWQGVDDQPYPERLNVRMKVELNQSGVIQDLRLVEPARRPLGNSPMGTAVDRALRAVEKCAPFRLPRDEYDDWREMDINLGLAFEPDQ